MRRKTKRAIERHGVAEQQEKPQILRQDPAGPPLGFMHPPDSNQHEENTVSRQLDMDPHHRPARPPFTTSPSNFRNAGRTVAIPEADRSPEESQCFHEEIRVFEGKEVKDCICFPPPPGKHTSKSENTCKFRERSHQNENLLMMNGGGGFRDEKMPECGGCSVCLVM